MLHPLPGRRIVVIGTSGSGKTTMARAIAGMLGVPHVELDALHWEPNWTEASLEVFRERVALALGHDAWSVDGNYAKVRDIVWVRADTVVWLDYPLWLIMTRLTRRTAGRIVSRRELWNGNRESLRSAVSRDSILLWALQTYSRHKREFRELIKQPEHAHLTVIHLHSPQEATSWLNQLAASRSRP